MKPVLTFLILSLVVLSLAVQGSAGPYKISLTSEPAVIPVGKARLTVKLTDAGGQPVSGATVKMLVQMPGMAMGEREETATPGGAGTYTANAVFGMAGAYDAKIDISGPKGEAKTVMSLQTGSGTEAGGEFPLGTLIIWGVVIVATMLVLWQIRRTGQKVDVKSIFNRQVLLSLLVLGLALVISVWAINRFRRPGSMTPMEAQGMEMNAPAPEGTFPVRLATAESKSFSASVTYSGQAVGFVEQDVVPRVTGTIVSMGVYVGDRVHKGQVLARLDTTQIDPMVSEKIAGVNSAEQGAGVAAKEYQQSVNMVAQARAESSMSQADLAEAQSMLEAAQQGRSGAESDVEGALAESRGMQAEQQAAIADRTYQQQELARMKSLYDRGAISKDEWQQAQTAAQKATAMADRASENVRRSQAAVTSARAMLRKTDAEIAAAKRKVDQAQASVRAKGAAVRTAESAADASKGKIGQSRADVAAAAAGLQGATTQRGYAQLVSQVDGVVTSRIISPGTVVNPGQVVLKVAQISPIRLQANVPESDLAKIHVGSEAEVTVAGGPGKPITAKVTSVSPALDTSSRTGIVEALVPNTDSWILPGQYLSMKINLGSSQVTTTVIPASAVQIENEDDGKKSYVWLATSSTGGEFSVSRQEVKLIGISGGEAAIESGLKPGDKVVLSPPAGLASGAKVLAPMEAVAATEAKPLVIEINAAGYNPPFISIPSGRAFQIVFVRTDDQACGKQIVFPELGIRKDLPLNVKVPVDIPALPVGKELKFTCDMNMLNGKAVAR